jgi:hypothetical protein
MQKDSTAAALMPRNTQGLDALADSSGGEDTDEMLEQEANRKRTPSPKQELDPAEKEKRL